MVGTSGCLAHSTQTDVGLTTSYVLSSICMQRLPFHAPLETTFAFALYPTHIRSRLELQVTSRYRDKIADSESKQTPGDSEGTISSILKLLYWVLDTVIYKAGPALLIRIRIKYVVFGF